MSSPAIPSTCKALIYSGPEKPIEVQTIPVPKPTTGSVLVRVLSSYIDATFAHIATGRMPGLTVPSPSVLGGRAVARVAALGPDTTAYTVGQLVLLEPFLRARDNPNVMFLWGAGVFGGDPGALKLSQNIWNNGTWAEYTLAPIENCFGLDEKKLCGSPTDGGLGYGIADLNYMTIQIVAYGGLRAINLQAGETILVAPATGTYSGAAVGVARAMGARVIAASRNLKELEKLAAANPGVEIIQLKDNAEEDAESIRKFGPIDVYIDLSPPAANETTHVRTCIAAVRPGGRVSLMGFLSKDIAIPYAMAVLNNLTIKGQYMYEKDDMRGLIKLVETGMLKVGKSGGIEVASEHSLEQAQEALASVAQNSTGGRMATFKI